MAASLQTFIFFLLSLFFYSISSISSIHTPHNDAISILAFKSKADLSNTLPFSHNTTQFFCKWKGVQCFNSRVIRLVLQGFNLRGIFAENTLSRLNQLRVLSLQDNSLTGVIPDLSNLINLKSLFLDHNSFSGAIPPTISSFHRLKTLDLSFNNLTGLIPNSLNDLNRLYYLRLDSNNLNGSIPPINIATLQIFNVSRNHLSGAIPVTQSLIKFSSSSFSFNPNLCGEIIKIECSSHQPFFGVENSNSNSNSPPPSMAAIVLNTGINRSPKNHKRMLVIIGFSTGIFVLIVTVLCFAFTLKKHKQKLKRKQKQSNGGGQTMASDSSATAHAAVVMRIEEENELEEKVKKMQMGRSGSLTFCAGESQLYSLEQLMKASAELLGKGSIGTTYKAVLDNRLIVSVKRLESSRMAGTNKEQFERHMESVGGLRHPNLVPLRAYFQAKQERLLVYDYQPNGSLFSLVHGSKSTRAKPLHWTSCLKIAEDIAQGLSYIHQAWRLVHGNLKSANVLLGSDFEACLTDYCLSTLTSVEDSDSQPYLAPEARKSNSREPTVKCDIYAYGVLLLELLTGKAPNEHLNAKPSELVKWVRSIREEHDGPEEDLRMVMLLEVAVACRSSAAEQRPTMWQVLKMIQEVKESVLNVDGNHEFNENEEESM
ncbi:probable inactive receptor kinase At5g67200 [Impatiens glandulifera]|uniref:probable inactive receptor kinase At5g67200 n=1 Tax=Impatiens glandulifera TaxID=253017 RepID=UPI001FB1897E|nr:probable inactive receptor kinase At5g67200 [Impatiens glandulifera]